MGRAKLWQVDRNWHCLIVGTCLTVEETREAAIDAGHEVEGIADYEMHHACVQVAADRSRPLARALHKRLEAKHARTVRRFDRERDAAALGRLWDEHRDGGGYGGALWALATHPRADEALRERAYGEVHMLQHATGRDAAGAHRREAKLEARVAALESRLADVRAEADARARVAAEREASLRHELDRARAEARRAQASSRPAPASAAGATEGDLARARSRLATTREVAARRATLVRELRARETHARAELSVVGAARDAVTRELERLEALVSGLVDRREAAAPGGSLCGRCVLVIGGDPNQCRRYRALVESADGTFLHHDGGVEERSVRVAELVRRADAVVCPTSRVSHDAMHRAKRLCRAEAKPMIFLERDGLASFADGLAALVEPAAGVAAAPI